MKTLKNRLFLAFVLVFAVAFSAFALVSFGGAKKVSAADAIEFASQTTISITDIAGTPSDTLTFEYKLVDTRRSVKFCLRDSNGAIIVNYFTLEGTGTVSANTSTEGISVTVESAEDDYYKVTITGAGVVSNTTRLYSNGGAYKSVIYVRDVHFAEYTITMVEGASVRTTSPYGIRFKANISEELYNDADAAFGMTIIPYDWVVDYASYIEAANGDYIAVLEQAGVNYRKFVCLPVEDGGEYYIQASLTNIKQANISRKFIGIAWYEKAGKKTYAFNKNCARSIKDVATKAIIAGEDYDEDQTAFLNGIVDCNAYDPSTAKLTYATESKAVKGEDLLVFYYKKSAAGTVRFSVVNSAEWGGFYGYFEIADDNTISAAGVTVETAGNDWYKVTLDIQKMTETSGDPSEHSYFDAVYFRSGSATFEVMGLEVEPRPAHSDKVAFTAGGSSVQIDAPETAAYTSVSFDYQITTNSGKMALGVFNSANNGGYGYYDFEVNGITAPGITCETLEDGWIHVVIDLTQTTKIFNSNQVSEFTRLYIRGSWSTASGYIDNVQWVLANS